MPIADFLSQLLSLGYSVEEYPGGRVVFPYEIPVGRFTGQNVKLGLNVPGDFPTTCPSGPHISPPLLPTHPSSDLGHPHGGVHEDPDYVAAVGGQWQYWSRPFPGWGTSKKTARTYMAHIRALFATQ